MDDKEIISLYFQRDQEAITQTDRKYGGLCKKVSYNILGCAEDVEECVSDTYLAAWDSIPPQVPLFLKAYLLKIVRNFSLMRVREQCAQKRGSGELELALEELGDCFSSPSSVEGAYEQKEVARAVSRFLYTLPETERAMFLCRYWHMASICQIAEGLHCSQSKIKTSLFRTRRKLQDYLQKEGLV